MKKSKVSKNCKKSSRQFADRKSSGKNFKTICRNFSRSVVVKIFETKFKKIRKKKKFTKWVRKSLKKIVKNFQGNLQSVSKKICMGIILEIHNRLIYYLRFYNNIEFSNGWFILNLLKA